MPLAFGGDVDTWIYRALALLIVACPCSLVISVPVAVVSAVGGAARGGILIKGGQALEDLARVRAVAIDKTGTLTLGLPQLSHVVALDGHPSDEALALVAAVERRSEHPLAAALRRAARERGLDVAEPDALRGAARPRSHRAASTAASCGPAARGWQPTASARLPGHARRWSARPDRDRARRGRPRARPVRPRRSAASRGRRRSPPGCAPSASSASSCSPATPSRSPRAVARAGRHRRVPRRAAARGQARAVEELAREQARSRWSATASTTPPRSPPRRVGIAMGAAGTDVALQSADVALMSDRLARLPDAIAGARQARSVMRANVIASLAVKAVFVLLAPFGLVTLVLAVAADMGMSLLVTLNALRLLRKSATRGRAGARPRAGLHRRLLLTRGDSRGSAVRRATAERRRWPGLRAGIAPTPRRR